jgi:hypothetical protein
MNARLFNCCTHNAAPDWSLFDALETGGCETETDETTGDTWTNGGIPDSEAEFWTVYGHLKEGGCEAITDCYSRADVDAVAAELSALSGLPVR